MSRELRQETLAEIEEELRSGEYTPLADRIHSAWERERVEIATKAATQGVKLTNEKFANLPIGNMDAVREALEALVGVIDECNSGNPLWWHIGAKGVKPLKDARAALAAPPRNCDVGTPKEQSARFDDHCRKHMGCLTCPLREKDGGVPKHCELAWSQMPYEEVN